MNFETAKTSSKSPKTSKSSNSKEYKFVIGDTVW